MNAGESRQEAGNTKAKMKQKIKQCIKKILTTLMNILPSCQGDSLSSSSREIQPCQNQFPITEKKINRISLLLIVPKLNVITVELLGISPMNAGSPRLRRKEMIVMTLTIKGNIMIFSDLRKSLCLRREGLGSS